MQHRTHLVLHILVREISVEVHVVSVCSAHDAIVVPHSGILVAVGVHAGHDVQPHALDDLGHPLVLLIILAEILSEQEQQFSPDNFVPVHVPYVLHLRLVGLVPARFARDLDDVELASLHRCADAVEVRDVRIVFVQLPQVLLQLHVVVVPETRSTEESVLVPRAHLLLHYLTG